MTNDQTQGLTSEELKELNENVIELMNLRRADIQKLKSLISDVTGDTSVLNMKDKQKVCDYLLSSKALGQAFFFEVFHYLSFDEIADTACGDQYKELIILVGNDLARCVNSATLNCFYHSPEFQLYVTRFLDQRTSPLEAQIAYLSTSDESSSIIDEYDAYMGIEKTIL